MDLRFSKGKTLQFSVFRVDVVDVISVIVLSLDISGHIGPVSDDFRHVHIIVGSTEIRNIAVIVESEIPGSSARNITAEA